MSFQTFSSSSKGGSSGSKPSSRAALRPVGWLADHQPQPSVGRESVEKENAPPHEYMVQPSRPVATNNFLRSRTTASNGAGVVTANAYCKSSSKIKSARPAPLAKPSSPSPSSPSPPPPSAATRPSTPPPTKVMGKRGSPSQEYAGPSGPSRRSRRIQQRNATTSVAAYSDPPSETETETTIPTPAPVHTIKGATPPQPSVRVIKPAEPASILGSDSLSSIPKPPERYRTEVNRATHLSPGENGDNRTRLHSDRPKARGGREKGADATMATRIAEVRMLKARCEYLVAKLHCVDPTADPSADDGLEDDLAEITAAHKAWRDAERKLLSPVSTSSPKGPILASTSSPVPNTLHAEHDGPSMVDVMREPYRVLRRFLDDALPGLPSAAANNADPEVETTEDLEVRNEETAGTRLPASTKVAPSEDSQGEDVSPPAPSAPPSPPASVAVQNEASRGEAISPSAPPATLADPSTDNATASTSSASTASTPFRFSGGEEALLLGHASAKRYTDAISMLPGDQQRLVLTSPAEIAAVRLTHPRPRARPVNKGKRKEGEGSENRKTRTHIGDDGAETELWVCRALFKVEKGCGGINYLESPCGYPVGTKDSWVRHLKDVHLGRVKREA